MAIERDDSAFWRKNCFNSISLIPGGGWEGVWRREEGGGYSQQFLNGEAPLRGATHYLLAPLSPKVIFSLNDKNTFF